PSPSSGPTRRPSRTPSLRAPPPRALSSPSRTARRHPPLFEFDDDDSPSLVPLATCAHRLHRVAADLPEQHQLEERRFLLFFGERRRRIPRPSTPTCPHTHASSIRSVKRPKKIQRTQASRTSFEKRLGDIDLDIRVRRYKLLGRIGGP
ncbi:hypothetical protein EJB05_25008, partial [Eragrostis curvula]